MRGAIENEALRLASLGYGVFPCRRGDKRPATKHGVKDATTDFDAILRWWSEMPDANIGLSTIGMVAIDVDGEGNRWPYDPMREDDLRVCPIASTPRGGRHYLFRDRGARWRSTQGRLAPHVDTRATGGYIVVAPSTVKGRSYDWSHVGLNVRPMDLPDPPYWLAAELDGLRR